MMNGLALCLLLTTLATAGVFSPTPQKQRSVEQDVIVKEGHRTVVVEYETDDGSNTKVLISPEVTHELHLGPKDKIAEKAEDAKDKLKETASPRQEEEKEEKISHTTTPRELVCDALGKCKHKIARAIGKTKEKVYEVEEEAKEAVGKVKDAVFDKGHEAKEKVKKTVSDVSDKAKEKAEQFEGGAKEKAEELRRGAEDLKEGAKEKLEEVKDGAKEKAGKLKRGAEDVKDSTKKANEDVGKNASATMEATKRKGKEAEEMLKDNASKKMEKGKKDMKEILCRGGEVLYDALDYIISPESLGPSIRIMQLFGFSMAFGVAIWVTFISSYILARALPRQQFAMVQSKIYPVYFMAMAYSIGIVLVAHFLSRRKRLFSDAAELLQGFSLLASLSMVLANLWQLEPRATKVMFERMKLEKEESRGIGSAAAEPGAKLGDPAGDPAVTPVPTPGTTPVPQTTQQTSTQEKGANAAAEEKLVQLSEQLKRLNSLSSFLNILTLMSLSWHLVHLGQRLQLEC